MPNPLHDISTQLQVTAREAGAYMLGARSADLVSKEKTNMKDFVTVADIKSQHIVSDGLQRAFPAINVVSEEDTEPRRAQLYNDDFTGFVIDPIDGTYNFKRDMRESAVSIGYIEQGIPKVGVIYDPYKDEMFSAVRGEGAYRNGVAIRVSEQADLTGASVATSNSYDDEAMARNLERHLYIYKKTGIMPWTSCPGSGVLIMTGIACGRFDAYHHNGLKPWDNAAAFLLIEEAGGAVERLDGKGKARFTDTAVLVGNKMVTPILRDIFSSEDALLG